MPQVQLHAASLTVVRVSHCELMLQGGSRRVPKVVKKNRNYKKNSTAHTKKGSKCSPLSRERSFS